jgi:hypothetical protein
MAKTTPKLARGTVSVRASTSAQKAPTNAVIAHIRLALGHVPQSPGRRAGTGEAH